jgi:hypothetical protein
VTRVPYILRIDPTSDGWRVSVEDGELIAVVPDFETAERRARFFAARVAVRGCESEIKVHDAAGAYCGCWRAERFEPAQADDRLAA